MHLTNHDVFTARSSPQALNFNSAKCRFAAKADQVSERCQEFSLILSYQLRVTLLLFPNAELAINQKLFQCKRHPAKPRSWLLLPYLLCCSPQRRSFSDPQKPLRVLLPGKPLCWHPRWIWEWHYSKFRSMTSSPTPP